MCILGVKGPATAGGTDVPFPVTTSAVSADTFATITATYRGTSKSSNLGVRK